MERAWSESGGMRERVRRLIRRGEPATACVTEERREACLLPAVWDS